MLPGELGRRERFLALVGLNDIEQLGLDIVARAAVMAFGVDGERPAVWQRQDHAAAVRSLDAGNRDGLARREPGAVGAVRRKGANPFVRDGTQELEGGPFEFA